MSWTDDRVSLLRKLWGEGHTAAEIAKKLGGVTRNAVIGKAHRMKLSNRVSPIQQNKKPANKNVARKVATPAKDKVIAKAVPKVAANTSEPVLKPAVKSDGKLYSLMELKPRQCRWPSGDPQEDNFGFCGDHAMPGLPYCEEHAKMAYQAATRNRIFSSAEKEAQKAKAVANKKSASA